MVGWLYEGADARIPKATRALLGSEAVAVSPIVKLELTYLHEIGRVSEPATAPLAALGRTIGLGVSDLPVASLVDAAAGLTWTRDPFDRLIAAHAIIVGAPLITADRTILRHLPQAVWD